VVTDKPSSTIDLSSTAVVTQSMVRPIAPAGTSPTADDFKVVCYFTNWAWYR